MPKLNIGGLLNELGVGGAKPANAPPPPATASDPAPAPPEASTPGTPLDALMAGVPHPGAPVERPPARTSFAPTDSGAPPSAATPATEHPLPPGEGRGEGFPEPNAVVPLMDPRQAERESPADAPAADVRQLLVSRGVVTAKQLTLADAVLAQSPGERLIDALIGQGVDEEAALRVLAEASGLPFERIDLSRGPDGAFDGTLMQRLTAEYCKEAKLLPLRVEHDRVVVGMARPDDVFTVDDVRLRLKARSVKVVAVTSADIAGALAMLGQDQAVEVDVESLLSEVEDDDVQVDRVTQDAVDLEKEAGESPVIRYVNYIIQQASKEGASDIHIEPGEKSLKVRYRIDGVLFESLKPPAKMAAAITSRLKIMGNLDISERRLPQDGRIRCQVAGRKLDLRMSTIPTAAGEKVVLRILDTRSISVNLEELGFDENTLTIWRHQIDQPHGVILVTGPTGSGKTTTLYASLRSMDKQTQNISTVEDPIEYHLDGITQTQTHEKIGMTFARALKALLRQDPDVIMIGEIRDEETARTAVQAALTGHLVLSTLHTNDAPSSITRLVNIGIEPFLIGAAVNAALAQRLVRKLCSHCKQPIQPTGELQEMLQMQGLSEGTFFDSKGCDRCRNIGFAGRVGIYELLAVDDHLRDLIARNPNVTEFRRLCAERGMVSLRQDGFAKVAKGLTTVPEVLRVTESTI